LDVTDYEATIWHSNWGKWKIRVQVDSAYGSSFAPEVQASYSHRIVKWESLESGPGKLDVYTADHARFMTVGGLFDDVDDMLNCQEFSCQDRHWFWPAHYIVEFDPVMGYPRSVTHSNEFSTVETRIETVKVLN
jgi:hypothetical protein